MIRKLFLSVTAVCIAATVFSQTTPKDSTTLPEVLVETGTGVQVNRNRLPLSITVVTRQQLDESGESALLPVLNGRVPGLFVTERGITGFGVAQNAAGQVTIRGIGQNPTTGVLILIDGHPQFMGIMGHPLADSYIASSAEKVEVIRGAASVLYGTNAMGGVVNIITRKNEADGLHGEARLLYGSYDTRKYSVSGGFKKNKFSVFVAGNHDQTDGHRANADFRIDNGYVKLGYDFSPHLKLSADFSLANFKTNDPGPDTANAVKGNSLDITRGYAAMGLVNTSGRFPGSLKFFYNFGVHDISDGFHSRDNNYGLNFSQSAKPWKGNTITVGADLVRYGGAAHTVAGPMVIPFVDTTLHEEGIYALVQQSFWDKLTLTGGLRYQHHSVYGGQWIPSAGFSFLANATTVLKASVSKGFRSPTIRELFMFNHNPLLRPERVMNYEVSAENYFAGRKLRTELTLFDVHGKNLIVTGAMGALYNGGTVRNKGIEFAADYKLSGIFSGNLTYSYTHMKAAVFATPRHHLFAGGTARWTKLSLSLNGEYVNGLNTEPVPGAPVHTEDYVLMNAKAGYAITRHLQVFISGDNLLDQRYETIRYYGMPGATVFGGVNLRL
ncbi:MAG: TonB-dependent receptor [Chitinophagaceae bacterium]